MPGGRGAPRRAQPRPPQGPRHTRAHRSHRVARTVGLVALAGVTFATSAVAFSLLRWQGNVTRLPSVSELVVAPTPAPTATRTPEEVATDPMAGRAVNLLVLGSDDRSGQNAVIAGAAPGGGSDTTMIVHLAADRSRVDVAAIPRDSRAIIPACHLDWQADGSMSSAQTAKFNKAFAIGWQTGDPALAAACTISTVQTMTGLTIDGFVIVDMAGFEGMVDAVGGVRVCVPEPLRDGRYTALDLSAGWHDLQGAQALDYVRARHIAGTDGTDPGRIERQQRFIGALLRKVLSSDVLTSPVALGRFLDAGTSSLMVSAELGDPRTMLGLAWPLRNLDSADFTFVTVPWVYGTGGYVDWTDDAALLWSRLLGDEPVNPVPVVAATPPAPVTPPPVTPPPDLPVRTPLPVAPAPVVPAPPAPKPDFVVRTADDPDAVLCG